MKKQLLILLAISILFSGCQKDLKESNSNLLKNELKSLITNENNQFKDLKSPSSQRIAAKAQSTLATTSSSGCNLVLHQQSSTFDKLNVIDPTANILYLGSLLDGNSIQLGTYSPIFMDASYTRKSITFSASIQGINSSNIKKTIIPALSDFRVAMLDITNSPIVGEQPANLTYEIKKVRSKSELESSLQTNLNIGHWASITANLNENKMTEKNYFIVKIFQKFFSADIDIPTDGNLFNKPAQYPSNISPVYISSIDYGRSAFMLFESSYDSTRVSQFLNSTLNFWKIGSSVTLTNDQKDILNEMKVTGSIIGGSSTEAAKTIEGGNAFLDYVKNSSNMTVNSRGAIIAYTLRNANNHQIYRTVFNGDYYTKECKNSLGLKNGDFIKNTSNGFYMFMFEGKLRHIDKDATLDGLFVGARGMSRGVTQQQINDIDVGNPLLIDNGLIQLPDGRVFFREGNYVRHINSLPIFNLYRFNDRAIKRVSNLNAYIVGPVIYK
ncbi:MAG: hemolysin [Sphingobacterium sp.]|jgi:thiol-activated cytolysin|nr:hemolysin [Sphingobacterium sp.]